MIDLHGYAGQLAQGTLVTLEVAFSSLACGLLAGILWALGKLSPRVWVRAPCVWLGNLLRGIPEFVILLICYFGLTALLYRTTGGSVNLSPFAGGVFALSVVFAAYSSESFRGAFLSVPRGQLEAARALAMRPRDIFLRIHLPQAWRLALPSLNNQWQSLLKDTSLVSVLGLEELMRKTDIAAQVTKEPFVFFLATAFIYLVFLNLSNPVFRFLERRASRGMAPR